MFHEGFMPPKLKKFLQSWLINTLAVLLAVYVVPGLEFKDKSLLTPCVTSLVLGILNAFLRPIMDFLALPLLIVTLGLFRLVINAALLYLVSLLLGPYFEVRNFWSALLGALVISVVSLILNTMTGTGNSRLVIQRRRRPPGSDDGGGPVIDV